MAVTSEYNPRVYQNPDDFKPSRWADAADRSAFTAFSIGPRTCVGNRFAQVEAVCFLSMFLKDWKLDVILLDGETREQWRDRVMIGKMMLVLEIGSLPIKMTRRAPLK
jgi:cytochrome P450